MIDPVSIGLIFVGRALYEKYGKPTCSCCGQKLGHESMELKCCKKPLCASCGGKVNRANLKSCPLCPARW